ncbi:MAG: hypothetical protein A2736_00190 [Candidatus Yanofskybacteria bacterium RIFCSPHIGHO2_01_FULL_41_27]|uniref:Uncharacterized protein n=4 Tax=Parcubacteria group TaxID=1794811 RepID=A0A1F8HV93_9BACT|nr:MAG: hypothetical protein UU83_C0007G0008 [Candidatus Jorgensenbacteria bacterium GW2011_GWF2_41_8]KKS26714.1 MAG: hypothetical protein UU84_C0019G0003 [Candidatus Yanofskybacteria bacterium GW2011_GWC2_41_9]OGM99679.1 MAG: hypothetical protein A2736_00190 [Candidatus Yanofskybacteria bacterium RIFCSPHIGHO2_01_FULL_41_27]OGN09752.1 MAG: hypothetical protein A3C64_00595 [Candidatus Yanofskybacteria bacterium RIFCSPHIGHO2_02_FULL_41_12]OGN20762.1 MAG: hypothetical protein A3B00_01030 [Candidat
MLYIIGLLIILGAIFSGFSGTANISGLVATAFNAVKNKIESVIFPKNEREILIENMAADYNILDRFFSQSAENILNSKDVSEKDKQAVKEAVEIFNKSKNNIAELGKMEKEDKSIMESLVEKVLNLEAVQPVNTNISNPNTSVNQTQPGTTAAPSPIVSSGAIPTIIPPYCRVECSQ